MLSRTPLFEHHQSAGGRMVEFAGYEMPLRYGSVVEEHHAVRTECGVFDVSHMGEFVVRGNEAEGFLGNLLPNDIARVKVGGAQYNALLTERGTFLDDLLVYRCEDHFMLVVNAAARDADLAWVKKNAQSYDVEIEDRSDAIGLLAVQGPRAVEAVGRLCDQPLTDLRAFRFRQAKVAGVDLLISRTGYTGEDGFELYLPAERAVEVWQALLESPSPVRPIGLGARDTLRLEAGLMLCGQDIDAKATPYEAGLGWIVRLGKRSFVGREALAEQRRRGLGRRLVGFEILGRGIARSGDSLEVELGGSKLSGRVTSGSWSPTLSKAIGLAWLALPECRPIASFGAHEFGPALATVRGRPLEAKIVDLPFYRRQG